jgi:hypothetical protein
MTRHGVKEKIQNRILRLKYLRSNSYPYLSGDLFADKSDVSVYNPFLRKSQPAIRDISEAKVIFCPSHEVERFFDDYHGDINAKILILGNSDRDFIEPLVGVPKSIKQIFCQNLNFVDNRYSLLPIGIENLRLARNGFPNLLSGDYIKIPNSVLIGPFSQTHEERKTFLDPFKFPDLSVIHQQKLSPIQYSILSKEFEFIACPRGNGVDTHRFWETLYRGSTPIVLESVWSSLLKKHHLPFVTISEWSEQSIKKLLNEINNQPFKTNSKYNPAIWWTFWENQIKGFV